MLLEADAVSIEAGYARLIIVYPPAKNHITYGNHRYTAWFLTDNAVEKIHISQSTNQLEEGQKLGLPKK